ncbi:MAG TPA: hypothetical protein VLT92_07905 [Burkholderiales bacterium]|nr:hypothetical protein [Burkholderiales bacterium]
MQVATFCGKQAGNAEPMPGGSPAMSAVCPLRSSSMAHPDVSLFGDSLAFRWIPTQHFTAEAANKPVNRRAHRALLKASENIFGTIYKLNIGALT